MKTQVKGHWRSVKGKLIWVAPHWRRKSFYDYEENWAWFDEIEDFKDDLKHSGYVQLHSGLGPGDAGYDAQIFAWAVCEGRDLGHGIIGQDFERSRGPGGRVRARYWDRQK